VGKIAKKYSAILSKVHSYKPLFQRFCPLGKLIGEALCRYQQCNEGVYHLFVCARLGRLIML